MININEKYIFNGTKGKKEVVVLDSITKMGSSIKNDALQSMDLSLNTYYKIIYLDKEIWVTSNFLTKE